MNITSKQIAALKYMIFAAKDGNELSKQVLGFLIDQSKKLTKEVCLSLVADREEYTADEIYTAGIGIHNMSSCNGTTNLTELLYATGSKLRFNVHYGDFDPARKGNLLDSDGMFAGEDPAMVHGRPGLVREGMPLRYTFWLSKEDYSRKATLVVATREKLEQINLKKPGLYRQLESQPD